MQLPVGDNAGARWNGGWGVLSIRTTNQARPEFSKLSAKAPDEVKPIAVVYQQHQMLEEMVTGPTGWINGSNAVLFDATLGMSLL